MVACAIGYLIAGFTKTPWVSLVVGIVILVIAPIVMHKVSVKILDKMRS
jgi:hypothetical protein